MKRQAKIMSKENYMKPFIAQHQLAFDHNGKTGSTDHGLHNDGGLPEMGNGFGWYSNNRLSYKEWYQIACGNLAHTELVEHMPR